MQPYDPTQLAAFAAQLKAVSPSDKSSAQAGGGSVLVVGHSNTTPQLVRLLGGQATDMTEREYSRLYQLIIDSSGKVTTVLLTMQ